MDPIGRWLAALRGQGVDEEEIRRRRTLLEQFCAFAGAAPEQLVEGCIDREHGRIRAGERRKVEALIDDFARAGDGDGRGSVRRANVIRSFLIHNGVRILTPRAPWL